MPQPIAKLEEPHAVFGRHDLAVPVQVREVRDACTKPAVRSLPDMAARLVVLQFAELLGKGELLFVGDVLVAEHQHGIFVHPGFDGVNLISGLWLAAIDTRNLGGKNLGELAKFYSHVSRLLATKPRRLPPRRGLAASIATH